MLRASATLMLCRLVAAFLLIASWPSCGSSVYVHNRGEAFHSLTHSSGRLPLRGGCPGGKAASPPPAAAAKLRKQAVTAVMAALFEQADAGNSTAMRLLGCCVSEGVNKKCKDAELAFRCFLSSAEQGDTDAQYNLGVCYATGRGVRQDQVKATRWIRAAAEAGDAEAMRVLAIRMTEGRGCESDAQAATATFVRAAEAGDPTAEFNLAVRYASGHGVPTLDAPRAKAFYLGGGEQEKPKERPKSHAPMDDFLDGLSDFEDEEDQAQTRIAIEWYKRAASQGHCKALYNLAQLMAKGDGLPLSQDDATDLLRQAAEKGYSRAQYALALRLARDALHARTTAAGEKEEKRKTCEELARDLESESVKWLAEAAAQGCEKALYAEGLRNAEGRGTGRNLTAAMAFFLRAHEKGCEGAWERYEECNTTLAWELFPEKIKKEREDQAKMLRKMHARQQAAKETARAMYFPMASNQKESRRLIAATLAQAEEKRQESLMVDMHEGLANCRRNMEKECKRVGGEAEAARERGQRGVIDVAEAMDTKYGIAEYLRQEEEEALLPPWERKNSHIEIRPLQENDYNLNKKSRHSPRFTRIDKDAPLPFDDMVEKVFHNKLTQLAPHNQAEVQTHSILRPFNPKAAAGGGGGEQEGVEKGGGLDRGREEGGESKKRDRNGVRWRQGSATEDNGRNAMAAFEEYSSRQDVVDVDALD